MYEITSIEEFNAITPSNKSKARYSFWCELCGTKTIKSYVSISEHGLKCTTCNKKLVMRDTSKATEAARSQSAKEKRKSTMIERYGRESNFDSEFVAEIVSEKYGVDNVSQLHGVKQKKVVTTMEHYGIENSLCLPESRERAMLNSHTDEAIAKMKSTKLERYGTLGSPHPGRVQYEYDDIIFDSSLEFAYYVHQASKGVKLKRNTTASLFYTTERGECRQFFPDFIDEDGTMREVKGGHLMNCVWNEKAHTKEKYEQTHDVIMWVPQSEIDDAVEHMRTVLGDDWKLQFRKK
jgi:hypothetical protein